MTRNADDVRVTPSGFQQPRGGENEPDPFDWLADRGDARVAQFLHDEMGRTERAFGSLTELRDQILAEVSLRVDQTELSVPTKKNGYWYYNRLVEGQPFRVYCRAPAHGLPASPPSIDAIDDEEILLDGNSLGAGDSVFGLGGFSVSPDSTRLAFSLDNSGRERFRLRIKDLRTGDVSEALATNIARDIAWSADGASLFYVSLDEHWRPHRVMRHDLCSADGDAQVYEEPDERFSLSVRLTRSEGLILISSQSRTTTEVRYLYADHPTADPVTVRARVPGVRYIVDHYDGQFLVLHNEDAPDFSLAAATLENPWRWKEIVPQQPGTRLISVDAFKDHFILALRRNGTMGLRVCTRDDQQPYDIDIGEELSYVTMSANPEYDTNLVRILYSSFVTPDTIFDFDTSSRRATLLRQRTVKGHYNRDDYVQHRISAVSHDGTSVPISLVRHRNLPPNTAGPIVMYGYGAYGECADPKFSITRLSLLDRGVMYAIAHVRGGGEMGSRWHDQGRAMNKANTFRDFISCADALIAQGWTSKGKLVARGGSAGGLIMGVLANEASETFSGIVAEVPFVDPLGAVLDPARPLTPAEWSEWGDPRENSEVYDYLRSYSPYQNVVAGPHPKVLATAVLNDARVPYHEPARWVSRLREASPDGEFLLWVKLNGGHVRQTGRQTSWEDEATTLAWILTVLNATHVRTNCDSQLNRGQA